MDSDSMKLQICKKKQNQDIENVVTVSLSVALEKLHYISNILSISKLNIYL